MKKLPLVGVLLMSGSLAYAAPDTDKKAGDFVRGVKAWQATCDRCHNMREPREFSDAEWSYVLRHMRIRAGLTGQDERDILKYLQQSNDR